MAPADALAAIHIPAVAHLHDPNYLPAAVDLVHDPIRALAYPVAIAPDNAMTL